MSFNYPNLCPRVKPSLELPQEKNINVGKDVLCGAEYVSCIFKTPYSSLE